MKRRNFLRNATAVAGVSGSAPLFFATAAPLDADEPAAGSGQTVRLAEYAAALRSEEIPAEIIQRAKDCITDTVAVILFGGQFPWSKMIIAQAQRMGSGGKSAILGTGSLVTAPAAALAHGALTHAFEQDNLTLPDSGAHPGAALLSSGLAIGQERGASGRDLLTAFVTGAEVMIRIGLATKRTNEERGFHAPGTVGSFGAAVAGGKLMKLDAAKMTNALGIAASTSGGLLEFARSGNGAMVKRLHLGRAAEGGVLAASLAADGFTGPTTAIEGRAGFLKAFCNESDASLLTQGLGKNFASSTILLKRFACHITAHCAVQAIGELRARHKITGSDVESIQVDGSRRMSTVNNIPKPPDILIGQFSIPFCVAVAMYRNAVDPYSFDDAATRDAAIMALASKVKMSAVAGQSEADVAANVTITLKDGRVLTQRVTEFLGTPSHPLTGKELREKFGLLTQKHPKQQMQRIYDRLQSLETEKNLDWLRV